MSRMTAGVPARASVAVVAVAVWLGGGHTRLCAQEDMVWTKEQIVERLARSDTQPLTRSLRGIVVGGGAGAAAAQPAASGWIDDFRVTFPFDSSEITPDAQRQLDILGEALQDNRLSTDHFEIAGHTDGLGDETYNDSLSERRAQAVVDYLERKFAIAPDRLIGKGYGEAYLADPDDPSDPKNRRVEILNLGSG